MGMEIAQIPLDQWPTEKKPLRSLLRVDTKKGFKIVENNLNALDSSQEEAIARRAALNTFKQEVSRVDAVRLAEIQASIYGNEDNIAAAGLPIVRANEKLRNKKTIAMNASDFKGLEA